MQELVPTRARLALKDGQHREVPADAVSPGDLLAVLPGEKQEPSNGMRDNEEQGERDKQVAAQEVCCRGDRMPVDGVVVSGRSTVDESALTGEPMPATKSEGEKEIGLRSESVNCELEGSCQPCSQRGVHFREEQGSNSLSVRWECTLKGELD
eukprot:1138432-Pelagomonas_calceolata.AAC.4